MRAKSRSRGPVRRARLGRAPRRGERHSGDAGHRHHLWHVPRRRSDGARTARLPISPGNGPRSTRAFRFYPLREHARLLAEVCPLLMPDRSLRLGLRALGRQAPRYVARLDGGQGRARLGRGGACDPRDHHEDLPDQSQAWQRRDRGARRSSTRWCALARSISSWIAIR